MKTYLNRLLLALPLIAACVFSTSINAQEIAGFGDSNSIDADIVLVEIDLDETAIAGEVAEAFVWNGNEQVATAATIQTEDNRLLCLAENTDAQWLEVDIYCHDGKVSTSSTSSMSGMAMLGGTILVVNQDPVVKQAGSDANTGVVELNKKIAELKEKKQPTAGYEGEVKVIESVEGSKTPIREVNVPFSIPPGTTYNFRDPVKGTGPMVFPKSEDPKKPVVYESEIDVQTNGPWQQPKNGDGVTGQVIESKTGDFPKEKQVQRQLVYADFYNLEYVVVVNKKKQEKDILAFIDKWKKYGVPIRVVVFDYGNGTVVRTYPNKD